VSPRPTYEKIVQVKLPAINGLRPHFVELRFQPANPPIQRLSAGYKVWVGDEFRELVRYDDDPIHDKVLHRHKASPDGPVDGVEMPVVEVEDN